MEVGSNEDQYLTDCVCLQIGSFLFIALNKRTKASEPFISEIVSF